MWKAVAIALAMFGFVQPVAAQDGEMIERLPVLAGTTHIEHHSPRLGRPLQIFIKRSDLADAETPLSVVYLLDADQAFPLMASYSWSLTFSRQMPPSIIVGIGYGSTQRGVNFRNTDYTVPSETRTDAGGAATFLDVLEHEIIPLVEGQSAADPSRRTLVGQSLGGHFVLYQAMERPGLFNLGVAINPAIHNSPEWFMERLNALTGAGANQSLFVSSADNDVPRFGLPGRALIRAMAKREDLPLCVKAVELRDHLHLTSMPRAFREAMRWRGNDNRLCGQYDDALLREPEPTD